MPDLPTAVGTESGVVIEGGVKKGGGTAVTEITNIPFEFESYFTALSDGDPGGTADKKAPEPFNKTAKEVSEAVMPEFEKAAKTDGTPLNMMLTALKLGQSQLKLRPEPPFWAAGFKRDIPKKAEEPEEDSGDSGDESDSPGEEGRE